MRLAVTNVILVTLATAGFATMLAPGCGSDDTSATTTQSGPVGPGPTSTSSTTNVGGGTPASSSTGMGGNTGGAGGSTGGAGGSAGGSGGAGGAGGGNSMNDQAAYYWGDFDTNGTHEVAIVRYPTGTPQKLSLMGLTGGNFIFSVVPSPNGSQIAVAGRDMMGGGAVINVYAADGTGAPTTVVDAANTMHAQNMNANFSWVGWSPDGLNVAYIADLGNGAAMRVYVSPANGSANPKLLSQNPGSTAQDAQRAVWISNTHLAFSGDLGTQNDFECVWSVDVAAMTPTQVELAPCAMLPNSGQDVDTDLPLQVDSMGRVYFRGDFQLVNNFFRMYRNAADGMSFEQVPGTALMFMAAESPVGSYGLSEDGTKLAFGSISAAMSLAAAVYDVFVLDLSGTTSVQVSSVQTMAPATGFRGADFDSPIWWSPDGMAIAVAADWAVMMGDADNNFAAFILPTSGNPGGIRLVRPTNTPSGFGLDRVNELGFSRDNLRLFARGDLVVSGDNELYGTTDYTTPDQMPTSIRIEESPPMGDVNGMAVLRAP